MLERVKISFCDALVTFLWVFSSSTLGICTFVLGNTFQVQGFLPTLSIIIVLVFFLIFIFSLLSSVLGGASFSPTDIVSFHIVGLGTGDLFSMAFRFPAQAIGAVCGALAVTKLMPLEYKHMLEGPSLKVDLHTGGMVEGFLTFLITLSVLFVVLRFPNSPVLKNWFLALITVALISVGSNYTGPSMNPANAFGWAYINNRHNTWEQFYVYWFCPFIGAVLAAWIFRNFFHPSVKQKKE